VAAARRAGRISPAAKDRAIRLLHRRWREFEILEAEEPLVRAAGEVAETFSLRAGDAIHLTSALVIEDTAFATSDRELRRAAGDAGLEVIHD